MAAIMLCTICETLHMNLSLWWSGNARRRFGVGTAVESKIRRSKCKAADECWCCISWTGSHS